MHSRKQTRECKIQKCIICLKKKLGLSLDLDQENFGLNLWWAVKHRGGPNWQECSETVTLHCRKRGTYMILRFMKVGQWRNVNKLCKARCAGLTVWECQWTRWWPTSCSTVQISRIKCRQSKLCGWCTWKCTKLCGWLCLLWRTRLTTWGIFLTLLLDFRTWTNKESICLQIKC